MLERKAAILVGLIGIVTVLGFISGVAPGLLLSSEIFLRLREISFWVSSSSARLCIDDDQCRFLPPDHHSYHRHCDTPPAAGLLCINEHYIYIQLVHFRSNQHFFPLVCPTIASSTEGRRSTC